jgi:hypothetical protein
MRTIAGVGLLLLGIALFAAPGLLGPEELGEGGPAKWLRPQWPRVGWVLAALAAGYACLALEGGRRRAALVACGLQAAAFAMLAPHARPEDSEVALACLLLLLAGAFALAASRTRARDLRVRFDRAEGATRTRLLDTLRVFLLVGPLREISEARALAERARADPDPRVSSRAEGIRREIDDALTGTQTGEPPVATPEPEPLVPAALARPVPAIADAFAEEDEGEREEEGDDRADEEEVGRAPLEVEIEELLATLRRGEPIACERAIRRLVEIGDAARPALRDALQGAGPDLRIDVEEALRRMDE